MNEEKIKNYWLGKLVEAEAEGLEATLATDAELFEQAQIIESELLDDYCQNELTPPERRSFEQNYLITAARREKLRFTRTFHAGLRAEKSPPIIAKGGKTIWQRISAFWNAPRLAVAAFTILLLTIGGFFLFSPNSQNRSEVARTDNRNSELPPFTPRSANETSPNIAAAPNSPANQIAANANSKTTAANPAKSPNADKKANPLPTLKPAVKPTPIVPTPAKTATTTLAAFILLPGTLRSEAGEQFITISPKTGKIKLQLKLPPEAGKFETYRSTLKTADGETVFTSPNLKSPNLVFPARKLENRTYILFLEGQTTANKPAESITEYTFRVKRQ